MTYSVCFIEKHALMCLKMGENENSGFFQRKGKTRFDWVTKETSKMADCLALQREPLLCPFAIWRDFSGDKVRKQYL